MMKMVGTVGYAPTTSRMSIEHSTNELCSLKSMILDYLIVILISKLLFLKTRCLNLYMKKKAKVLRIRVIYQTIRILI